MLYDSLKFIGIMLVTGWVFLTIFFSLFPFWWDAMDFSVICNTNTQTITTQATMQYHQLSAVERLDLCLAEVGYNADGDKTR